MANSLTTSSGAMLKIGMSVDSAQAKAEFNKTMKILQQDSQIRLTIDGTDFTKTIKTYQDSMKNLVQTTTLWNHSTSKSTTEVTGLTSAMERVNNAIANQTNQVRNLSNAQNNLNTHTQRSVSVFQDFTDTFLKMAKFNTINLIYDGIINKMSEAIQITNDFDAAMTEFKKVTDTSAISLSDYTEELGRLGEVTASTTTEMVQAATEFSKGGFNAEESAKLAQIANLYMNIADAEISAGEASSYVISQMKAFDIKVEDAISIIDKTNEVSNNFAVSSTDIASALTKQSASLAAYGNSIDKSIALVTAGTEIMTGQAGKVARGLRTIGANVTQLAQGAKEFDIQVRGATKTIKLWNDAGTDMLDTYDVLKQISAVWDDMTNAEKSNLAVTLAKKTQMDTFLAVLGNFEDAERAYVTALKAEGSANDENLKYMESIEAHQKALKEQWEQLVLSQPFAELELTLLNTATALLKFTNSDVGQTIIKITSLIAVMSTLNATLTVFKNLAQNSSAGSLLNSIYLLITGETTLTAVTETLTTAMLANPLFWGAAIITGGVLLINLLKKLSHAYEEQVQKLRETSQEFVTQKEKTEDLEKQLEELQKKIEEVNKQKLEITSKEDLEVLNKQSDELTDQETKLKNQLILEQAKTKELEKQAKLELDKSLKKDTTVTTYDFSQPSGYISGNIVDSARGVETANPLEGLHKQLEGYEALKNKLQETEEQAKHFSSTQATAIEENLKVQNELKTAMSELESEMVDNLDVAKQAVELNSEYGQSAQFLIDKYNEVVDVQDEAKTDLDGIRDSVENLTNAEEEESNAWDSFLDNIENIQSAYETLNKAAEDYNKNGFITASTLKKLNKLNPEYIAQLEIVNGKMQVGNGLLQQEFENEKQLAIDAVLVAKNLRVQAICQQYVNDQTDKTKTASEQAAPKVDELKTSFHNLSIEARKAGTAVQYAYASIGNDEAKRDELQQQLDDVDKWADGMIDSIKAVHLGAVESSKSAASSSKDAWVEAFKEEQRQLKHSLEMNEITEIEYYEKLKDLNEKYFGEVSGKHKKYLKEYQENEEEIYKGLKSVYEKVADYLADAIEQGYEDAINALKKEEKRVLAEIKAQIEALKKEKQQVLDEITNQINDLKKQKDKVMDYWNSQIDKIKEANNQLQQQNELLEKQQALQQAKAQKVMVMKDGKFQLSENESAVAQAEQALSEYQDQMSYEQQIEEMENLRDAQVQTLEDRIEALEEYKDYMEQYYDEQIEALEQYYDEVQRQYEEQIEALQEQLDAFKKGAEQQKKIEEARLAARALGINKESELFKISLENAQKYVEKYNEIMEALGNHSIPSADINFSTASFDGLPSDIGGIETSLKARASGDSNFANDEIALVGESPNAELVIGSHLNRSINSGKLVNLSKGSGVVNAESTSTLAGLLNGIVTPTNVSNSKATTQSFNFGSISLPNVTDADSFVNTLSHKFNNYAIQYSSNRR